MVRETKASRAAKLLENTENAPALETGASVEPRDESEPSEKSSGSVSVITTGGLFIRQYHKSVHGKDFKSLAEQFAGKDANRKVVSSDKIGTVKVNFREPKEFKEDGTPADGTPFVDKTRKFDDKDEAVEFAKVKHGTVSI